MSDTIHQDVQKLVTGKREYTVEEMADKLDVAPRHIREVIDALRLEGFRVPDDSADDATIHVEKINPAQVNLHKTRALLDGDTIHVGVVSDTHLCSNEQALAELHLAYDEFEREGITEVWHAGDLVAGIGVYRTQRNDIHEHTFEAQANYATDNYPKRDGIKTRMISGNHDVEGEFGRIGANPVVAVANRRDDIEFLGDFSAWVELPNGAWVHLLHGKGGMSYAVSYKAQKLVDSYPSGRKPVALIPGHWHVRGDWQARGVQTLFPGCFEWRTNMMERLGLTPAVGFHTLKMTLGEDGSLVGWEPKWHPFWEGRQVGH